MSALGQKQTCAVQNGMSALPPKADMCGVLAHVCFVPIAELMSVINRAALSNRFEDVRRFGQSGLRLGDKFFRLILARASYAL